MMFFPPGLPAAATRCERLAARQRRQRRLPPLAAVVLLLSAAASVWVAPAGWQPARAATLKFRCTNAVSGVTWPVVVDLDHGLVDSLPATITDSRIEWRDSHSGVYEFERATGKLRLRNASSTGGYFLYYTCRPE